MVVRLTGVGVSSWRMKVECFNKRFLGSFSAALPPVPLPSSSSETHLWYMIPDEVKNKELLNEYTEILSPCEKKILSQIQGDEPKKRALLARALIRTAIARYKINSSSSVSPESLRFTKNGYGKPELVWGDAPSPLHFNISHTSSLVACAVTVGSPVGIDMELKDRMTKHNVLSLARRYFSEHEVRILSGITDPRIQRHEFIKLWTLKEAYVKALGKGFSGIPFKTFTIGSFPETSEIVVASSDDLVPKHTTKNWRFILLEVACSHYVAICTGNTSVGVAQGDMRLPLVNLMVRKTIPFLEDERVSGTGAVVTISGLTNWL